ncbi:acetylcholine receptor subunit delta-like [Haliotis rubra]|uniref:acetylcholine receptor subunit delta-like n=1 Tax=Haliotis rubra TaxID=36100 RepID=UPI001EE519CC|nr:acetylcholine receptor subunit delta-like [Haliotis rubra]
MYFMSALTLLSLVILSDANNYNTTQSTIRRLKTYLQGETESAGISVDHTEGRQVNISILPMSISNLNAAEQTFKFSAGVNMKWIDQNLAWNTTEYDGIENVTISADYVWIPSVVIPNGIDNVVPTSAQSPVIYSEGVGMLLLFESFKTSCQIDISLYPFDQQRCSVLFMPVNGYTLEVSRSSFGERLPSFFIENSEWELVDILAKVKDVEMTSVTNFASFEFLLKRKSMFYIVSIILPMTLLSLLNACVFLLPPDSGEKMSYLISIFVSYAVFMNFVNDSIPKSGDVCRLSVYLTLVLCQSCLAIITAMVTLNNICLFQPKTGVQPADVQVETKSSERQCVKSAHNARRTERVLFGVFLLLALMSLLVFCM